MKGIFMKKLLRITAKGETIIAHGRVVRTPVDIKLTDDEFSNIKIQLRSKGISEEYYYFGPIVIKDKKVTIKDMPQDDTEPIVEKLKLPEDLTYLERLAAK